MHLIKFKEELSKIEFQTNRIWNREQIRGKFLHMFSLSVFHLRGRGEKKQIGLCLNLWRDFFLGFRLGLVSNNCLLLLASKAKQQTQSSVLNKQEWKRKEKDFICLEKKLSGKKCTAFNKRSFKRNRNSDWYLNLSEAALFCSSTVSKKIEPKWDWKHIDW
jgi:hypothetical protein